MTLPWEIRRICFVERLATLAEVRRSWGIDDVLDAYATLDQQIDFDVWARGPVPPRPRP